MSNVFWMTYHLSRVYTRDKLPLRQPNDYLIRMLQEWARAIVDPTTVDAATVEMVLHGGANCDLNPNYSSTQLSTPTIVRSGKSVQDTKWRLPGQAIVWQDGSDKINSGLFREIPTETWESFTIDIQKAKWERYVEKDGDRFEKASMSAYKNTTLKEKHLHSYLFFLIMHCLINGAHHAPALRFADHTLWKTQWIRCMIIYY